MPKRKLSLRVPTHKLIGTDGKLYAEIRCGKGSPAVRLSATNEVNRSASFILDCELLMGCWQNPLGYLFGYQILDEIPEDARMVEIEESPNA